MKQDKGTGDGEKACIRLRKTHVASSVAGRLSQDLSSMAVSVFSAIVGGGIKSSILLGKESVSLREERYETR